MWGARRVCGAVQDGILELRASVRRAPGADKPRKMRGRDGIARCCFEAKTRRWRFSDCAWWAVAATYFLSKPESRLTRNAAGSACVHASRKRALGII
ncbi:hypothetical protein BN2476_230342 [Paraburkholderia piptadeniae]|uniref:Uncharacterized protein n=1 Tax=Paraburkholderia piptadeniae TaxID=1701573 RepID=A0A1N7RY77_9BURK|nr:hypothetical protein BN2476_230342 [Paraburkholderia piptadeniae]